MIPVLANYMPVDALAIGIAYRDKKMIATKIAMIPMTIGIHRKIARSKNPPTLKAEGPVRPSSLRRWRLRRVARLCSRF